jgi:hypothetical protein
MADKGHGDELVAKRLATGEIAVGTPRDEW